MRINRYRVVAGMLVLAAALGATACTDVLVEPESTVSGANLFDDPESYRAFLAKLYAGLAVTGQQGPSGNNDIQGIDEGFGQYLRVYWKAQVLPTEEAVISWGDAGLPELIQLQWGSTNQFLNAMYYRAYYQIALVNEFLRETTTEKLEGRGASAELQATVQQYRAEARWLRALSYWHVLDLFGNVPLVDENFVIGSTPPEQAQRTDIVSFVEAELLDLRADLPPVGAAEYGRADQGAAAMLLAKLYLNAQVYGAGDRYADAMTEASAVIGGPYQLDDDFQDMFQADNHTSPELVFAIPFDGDNTQTWGGTTFLVNAAIVGSMEGADYGTGQKWNGLRVTPEFVGLFENGATGPDARAAILYTDGQSLDIPDFTNVNAGYGYPKFRNLTEAGVAGSNSTHPDTDFPMFRLADAYLMYAEACLRTGGGACEATALDYVNMIRQRAYGPNPGDITAGELTLDFILDERARELAWEAHRRTDLVRYGVFTTADRLWAWKGGTQAGQAVDAARDLFPIPANELLANPNMEQNPGY
jgi:hypothetical protein